MKLGAFEAADDVVLPFAVEALDVRGRVVRLGAVDRHHPRAATTTPTRSRARSARRRR